VFYHVTPQWNVIEETNLMKHAHSTPLLCGLVLAFAVAGCSGSSTPSVGTPSMDMPRNAMGSPIMHPGSAQTGFTPGWLKGRTVQFFYHTNNFFCRTPVADGQPVGSTSGCEVGSDGTVDPRPGQLPILFVMSPVGFRPADSTLHCPIVGQCINHPSTIDLSRLFGPTTANAPLPAHSHIVDQVNGNWWEMKVIGVKDLATWNQIVAGKSLATVRALQAADPSHTHITGDNFTNTYLFFEVKP
jgi:hypothetical protein